MTKAERRVYNRLYYQRNQKKLKQYKAQRYAEDPEYRRNLKIAAQRRKEETDGKE